MYKVGYSLVTEPDEDHDKLREKLDEIGDELFYAAGLPPIPLSKLLMPFREEEELPPEMPEEFPEPSVEEPVAEAEPMADVVEDSAPVASLEPPEAAQPAMADAADTADAAAMADTGANTGADAHADADPIASEGDVLPVKQGQPEPVATA